MNDAGVIFLVWGLSLALQVLGWSWSRKFFDKLKDEGWAMGRLVSWLIISLVVWILGHWGMRVNNGWGIGGMVLILTGSGLVEVWRKRGEPKRVGSEKDCLLRLILWEEGLFALGLVGLSVVRGFEPSIFSLEKFMDYGFIKKYMVSESLPVEDIWWAGKAVNYYSFGHFMVSVLVRIWGIGLERGYNLALGFILGLSLSLSFSLIVNGSKKKAGRSVLVVGGVMGALLSCLGGNSYVWWYLIKNRGWEGFWYADATRLIERTIHEFPGYSFVVSDLHAHVLDLPVVLGFLIMMVVWIGEERKRRKKITEVVLGGLLGVMLMTNTWDVAVYGLVVVVVMGGIVVGKKKRWSTWKKGKGWLGEVFGVVMRVGMGGLLVGWWWWSYFKSIPKGVRRAMEHSPIDQWLILWGGHLVLMILAWWMSRSKGEKERVFVRGLIVVGVILLLIPEFVYVEDIYTGYPRANTMFKLTYQAFILMSLVVGWLVNEGIKEVRKRWGKLVLGLVIVLWGGLMMFPFLAYPVYYGDFKNYEGLDGLEWMRKEEGDKWEAVRYLEEYGDGRSLLEAGGDSYTRFNSVSAFSGTSSVVGWKVHEWLWRGGYDRVRQREVEVEKMFEMKKGNEEMLLIKKYGVGWIYLGKEERKKYEVNEVGLRNLGKVVWKGQEAELIKIRNY